MGRGAGAESLDLCLGRTVRAGLGVGAGAAFIRRAVMLEGNTQGSGGLGRTSTSCIKLHRVEV